MMAKGLLIDYKWCTGCHTCEMACRKEHHLADDDYGIKISEFVWQKDKGSDEWQDPRNWQYTYVPVPLDACDLCAARTVKGKLPACVHHCQAQCISYGEIDELTSTLAKEPDQALFCKQVG